MKPLMFKKDKDFYGRPVYHICKNDKSGYVHGSMEWEKRHKSWYFYDWVGTIWSAQHIKEISDFMKKLKDYD